MNAIAPHQPLELAATEPLAEAAPPVAAVSGVDLPALQAALERLGRGCARRIEFDVDDRSVRLRGFVRSYFQKQLAQHHVMQIAGVELVINLLSVEQAPETRTSILASRKRPVPGRQSPVLSSQGANGHG